MTLINVESHLFVRFVKLAGLALRFHFADDPLENFHRLQTTLAFVALDMHLDAAVGRYRDFKFALGHNLCGGIKV